MAIYVEKVVGTMGNVGMPGAPILHFELAVTIGAGSDEDVAWPVSGSGTIAQAIAEPGGPGLVSGLTGFAYRHGAEHIVIVLDGIFSHPPAEFVMPFKAFMHLNNNWKGHGSYTYSAPVVHVPVSGTVVSS